MKQYKLTVVAWKYNDIYYAMSTSEFRDTPKEQRLLIYFAKNKLKDIQFPGLEHFGHVISLKWSDYQVMNIFYLFFAYKYCRLCRSSCLSLSNPYLTINLFIAKTLRVSEIITLEDGLMNYYSAKPNSYTLKNRTMKFLQVSYNDITAKISTTYLWRPDLGVACFGKLKRLNTEFPISKRNIDKNIISQIAGKSIFVDTPIYKGVNSVITKNEYKQIINNIIDIYKIDYYLPHAFSDDDVTVNVPLLDIYSQKLTLEYLAMVCHFSVYSLFSTLLVSTKFINPSIYTCFINIGKFDNDLTRFIKEHSSETVDIESLKRIIR